MFIFSAAPNKAFSRRHKNGVVQAVVSILRMTWPAAAVSVCILALGGNFACVVLLAHCVD